MNVKKLEQWRVRAHRVSLNLSKHRIEAGLDCIKSQKLMTAYQRLKILLAGSYFLGIDDTVDVGEERSGVEGLLGEIREGR